MPGISAGTARSVTVTLSPPHDHTWSLQAVHLEDGTSLEEFGCDCGAVEFR